MILSYLSAKYTQGPIEELLRATGRENVERLLHIMEANGYYRAGCHGHHNAAGGLAHHSLEVLLRMQHQNDENLPVASIIIVALLHDLCNMHGFKQFRRHGSRSVLIATREAGFKLTAMEYQAILWHMHGPREKGTLGSQFDAVLDNSLWKLLRKVDHYSATHPMDKEDLLLAINGAPRRRRETPIEVSVSGHSASDHHVLRREDIDLIAPSTKKKELSPEEKHLREVRSKTSFLMEVFGAIRMRGIDIPEDVQNDVLTEFEIDHTDYGEHNRGFKRKYLEKAPRTEVESHRLELMYRCQRDSRAAKMAARYIYDEHIDIFDIDLGTRKIFQWLKEEFAINAEESNFFHACRDFKNYTNRK